MTEEDCVGRKRLSRPPAAHAGDERAVAARAHPAVGRHLPGRPRAHLRSREEHRLARADQPRAGQPRPGVGSAHRVARSRRCALRGTPRVRIRTGLDVGSQFLRGAVTDITGTIRARASSAHAVDDRPGPGRRPRRARRRPARRAGPVGCSRSLRPCSAAPASTTRAATTSRSPVPCRDGRSAAAGTICGRRSDRRS